MPKDLKPCKYRVVRKSYGFQGRLWELGQEVVVCSDKVKDHPLRHFELIAGEPPKAVVSAQEKAEKRYFDMLPPEMKEKLEKQPEAQDETEPEA